MPFLILLLVLGVGTGVNAHNAGVKNLPQFKTLVKQEFSHPVADFSHLNQ